MSLKEVIKEDMKNAMKAHEKEKLSCIRMLLAAMKQIEVDERVELDDARIIEIVTKMIKQRKETVKIYEESGHADKAAEEGQEITWLEAYLPAQLSEEEVAAKVEEAIKSTGASSVKDMGKVMGVLKSELAGCADMGLVSKLVKAKLG